MYHTRSTEYLVTPETIFNSRVTTNANELCETYLRKNLLLLYWHLLKFSSAKAVIYYGHLRSFTGKPKMTCTPVCADVPTRDAACIQSCNSDFRTGEFYWDGPCTKFCEYSTSPRIIQKLNQSVISTHTGPRVLILLLVPHAGNKGKMWSAQF